MGGIVPYMTPNERQQTQADFLLVAQKLGGGIRIPAVNGFDNITTKPDGCQDGASNKFVTSRVDLRVDQGICQ